MNRLLATAAVLIALFSCQRVNPEFQQEAADPEFYHRSMKKLTDVIVHDIFSPPVAARIYSYANIAGYEALMPGAPEYRSFAGQLRGLEPAPQPESDQEYCYALASVHAFLTVGRTLIFSEEKIDTFHQDLLREYRAIGISSEVFDRSLAYGEAVAQHILAWSGEDNYKQTRTFPKYSISNDPAHWQPTPPAYMDGIEPSWNQIRPFVLESADQFAPPPPTPFDLSPGSQFHQEALEVYSVMNTPEKDERAAIAQFWDCNPYVSHQIGHVMFATKKITPGGHWMNIAGLAARQTKSDLPKSVHAYALTAISLNEGFISCWDEKYRSRLLRPETYINRYIDEDWLPLLQTPPFPEHTSGHSVVSTAASLVLSSIFGDNFAFADDTEVEFGLPVRSFRSFAEAAEEAALSRLYGGIHYRPAIDHGVTQGRNVGQYVLGKVSLRRG
ncbi:MAG: vanadium-dependent haloperoxidase [Saprospiraceae bacterium]|nr:vanadium-dependent haloperoxidase [Saprospiraceae bacterium]